MIVKIIDDSKEEADKIISVLSEYFSDKDITSSVEYFNNAESFVEKYEPQKNDVIFMDIYMDGMTGLQAVELLQKKADIPYIIILTQSPEHMQEAFHLHVFDYLLKPVEQKSIFKLMDDISSKISDSKEVSELSFIYEKMEYNLPFESITVIKSEGHYLEINTISGQSYKTRMTFSEVEEKLLEDKRFLTVLRGILVNMDYIKNIKNGTCDLENGNTIPVNIKNCKRLEQLWHSYMFNKIKDENLERLR